MIYYCEQCKQYWQDEMTNYICSWSYCTIDGIQIMLCPMCAKEASEIIKDLPDSTEDENKENGQI